MCPLHLEVPSPPLSPPPFYVVTEHKVELPVIQLFLAIYFIYGSVCFSAILSFRPILSLPCCAHVCSLCLCLYPCPENRFVSACCVLRTKYSTWCLPNTDLNTHDCKLHQGESLVWFPQHPADQLIHRHPLLSQIYSSYNYITELTFVEWIDEDSLAEI